MFRKICAIALAVASVALISSAKADSTPIPAIGSGIYRVSFWINSAVPNPTSATSACDHPVTPPAHFGVNGQPDDYYADEFPMAYPGPGQTGAVEYYSLLTDSYTAKHYITYPTTPTAGQVVWQGHLDGDPLEEGTNGGHFKIILKHVDDLMVFATMDYTGHRADGTECVVNANLDFEFSGALR